MFRKRIQDTFPNLSPSYQMVGRFLLDHYHEAVFMSANQLAAHLGVDAATVVRFAQRLGYAGYPALLADMRRVIQQDLHRSHAAPPHTDDMVSAALASIDLQVNQLRAMRASLDQAALKAALERLLQARRIYTMGEGVSHRLADVAAYMLRAIGLDATRVEPNLGDALNDVSRASADDALLVVAVTELCPQVSRVAASMKEREVPSVGLVGALSWPVARLVEVALPVPIDSVTFLPSFAASSALINAMIEGLMARHGAWTADFARGVRRLAHELLTADTPFDFDTPQGVLARLKVVAAGDSPREAASPTSPGVQA